MGFVVRRIVTDVTGCSLDDQISTEVSMELMLVSETAGRDAT